VLQAGGSSPAVQFPGTLLAPSGIRMCSEVPLLMLKIKQDKLKNPNYPTEKLSATVLIDTCNKKSSL
jgi:hypothetical protein